MFFQFGNFAPKTGGLAGLRNARVFKIRAQFSVFPQEEKSEKRGESHKYQEEDGKEFHRLLVSLVMPDLMSADLGSMLER